jgi:peptidoglycan hydrolase FlgJ
MSAQILTQNSALLGLGQSATPDGKTTPKAKKAWAAAQNFESIFVKNLLSQAFAGVKGDGPMGTEGQGTETWRDLLVTEYAKTTTKAGGIGVSNSVYSELMKVQEGKS